MGCTQTKSDVNDINPRMFHVLNVDDHGREVNEGFIEISDNELTLLQKYREAISWPLKCLRRYGFESELFSFESGRRCPTGPGIFAFKCRRAELLFNTLQECIQLAGQHDERTHAATTRSRPESVNSISPETNPRNGTIQHMPASQETFSESLYINGAVRQIEAPSYMNTVPRSNSRNVLQPSQVRVALTNDAPSTRGLNNGHTINYAVLDLPRSTENLFELEPVPKPTCNGNGTTKYADIDVDKLNPTRNPPPPSPVAAATPYQLTYADLDMSASAASATYMNVVPERDSPPSQRPLSVCYEDQRMYANLDLNGAASAPHGNSDLTVNRINYIELDLDNGSDSTLNGQTAHSPTSLTFPESPTKRTEMYARIDFNRTAALSNSTKASGTEDDGQRKTRHNSTINELP